MENKTDMAERTIVDVANALKKYALGGAKLNIGEHPALPGGVGPGHSPTGYHYTGEAIDVRDWRPDVAPAYEGGKPISWKQRTGELAWRAKQLGIFNEALGPGDKGHDTHVHLALAGKKYIPENQLEWLATGRWKTPESTLSDVMPTVSQSVSSENAGSVSETTALAGLFGGLLNMMPKQKTLQEQLMETAISSALTPKKSSTSALLQLARSGPLDEIIYG